MAEVMEVEVRQACGLTGLVKGMSDVVVASSLCIVKDPRDVLPGVEPIE